MRMQFIILLSLLIVALSFNMKKTSIISSLSKRLVLQPSSIMKSSCNRLYMKQSFEGSSLYSIAMPSTSSGNTPSFVFVGGKGVTINNYNSI